MELRELIRAFRRDAVVVSVGSILSIVLASLVLSGFPRGLLPNLTVPYIYAGDGLFQYAMIQRTMEGWIFNNDRLGYPFGSPWFDYPSSDAGNLFLSKLLGLTFGSYYAASNAYILLGFALNFAVAFFVLRRLDIRLPIAFSVGIIFTFAPYHLSRLMMGHTFYTLYFAVPLYFYCGYCIFSREKFDRPRTIRFALALLITSSFGVYFALFGIITIMISGIAAAVQRSIYRPLVTALLFAMVIVVGVGANVAPSLLYALKYGKNPQVAQREGFETEFFSLKLIHLLLPPPNHRLEALSKFSNHYFSTFPLSNTISYVGVWGMVGLALLILAFLRAMTGNRVDRKIGFVTILAGFTLITTTVGGLNVLFAMIVSPSIRGWDRFSIFMLFYALCATAIWVNSKWRTDNVWMAPALAFAVMIGLADQTARSSYYSGSTNEAMFRQDRSLVRSIEALLPPGSAIYQLPYMPFPESLDQVKLQTYQPLVGFLNSKRLKWSAGGMMGRKAAEQYRELSEKPLPEQLAVIKQMGFAGIYVQHAGYADDGKAIVRELTELIGHPPMLTRADGKVSFFRID